MSAKFCSLQGLDQNKASFKYIGNDVSLIHKLDIQGKLPEPQWKNIKGGFPSLGRCVREIGNTISIKILKCFHLMCKMNIPNI